MQMSRVIHIEVSKDKAMQIQAHREVPGQDDSHHNSHTSGLPNKQIIHSQPTTNR